MQLKKSGKLFVEEVNRWVGGAGDGRPIRWL
jgi:hypothetical protein